MSPSSTSPRRTQAERTATTRTALLEATVAALAEHGYARASTADIARRAGVSRGAQLHHFPAKLDLVSAALDHVFAEREAEFRRRFTQRPPSERTQAGAVAALWEINQGPEHLAFMELLTAARTDSELRPLGRRVLGQFEAGVAQVFADVLPGVADDPSTPQRVLLALTVVQGAALHQQLGMNPQADDLVATLAALADAFPVGAAAPVIPPTEAGMP
ncbi:MAG: TetR/AcrR family transcriptional regulator [Acidimicrobiales bacterium]